MESIKINSFNFIILLYNRINKKTQQKFRLSYLKFWFKIFSNVARQYIKIYAPIGKETGFEVNYVDV